MKVLLWFAFAALLIGPIPYAITLSHDSQKALASGFIWALLIRQFADALLFKRADVIIQGRPKHEPAKGSAKPNLPGVGEGS